MTDALVLNNLLTWSTQVALVVMVAAVGPLLLRLIVPRGRVAYWQLVLLACLCLPFLRALKQETLVSTFVPGEPVSLTEGAGALPAAATWSAASWILALVALGCAIRFGWLMTGFWRMRRYRRQSAPLEPPSSWSAEADLRVSDFVQSPVMFGYRHPVVLLPRSFPGLDEATREAILCHEVMHIRRNDWLFTVTEEFIRTLLWFHPAIWWVLGEIQLAREQAVDRDVIGMTNSRDEYVDALLAMAGAKQQPDLAPAPLFLRKRHLKQRVISLLKEVHMSRTRSLSAFAASVTLLAASCWFITGAIPLYGAPQVTADSAGVAVETNGARLLHRNAVLYPSDAAARRIEGVVTVQVNLDSKGNVADARILSGPEELRKTVLQSVLNWHFGKEDANSTRQIGIAFELPKPAPVIGGSAGGSDVGSAAGAAVAPSPAPVTAVTPAKRAGDFSVPPHPAFPATLPTLRSIDFAGNEQTRNELMALLPLHTGDSVTPELANRTAAAVHDYDEHLRMSFRPVAPNELQLVISPPANPLATLATDADVPKIRVGGDAQQSNLITKVNPFYPPLAKAARIQGTVQFEVTIAPDGHVENLNLLAGPPLLVPSAQQAVQQWVYRPTLLNGNPVRVVTVVDVNYTLIP
jgi:TonB family protein